MGDLDGASTGELEGSGTGGDDGNLDGASTGEFDGASPRKIEGDIEGAVEGLIKYCATANRTLFICLALSIVALPIGDPLYRYSLLENI